MHSLLKSFLVAALVVGPIAYAQPEGEVVIRTRDGKSRQGRVISETQRGYLFASARGTSVIEFTNIVDLQKVEAAPEIAPAQVPPPLVAAAPVASAAPAAVVAAPPPPPERPVETVSDVPAPVKSSREGFHFGIGAGVGVNNGGPSAQVQAHFDFNFGRPVYRVSANLGGLGMYGFGLFNVSIDNLFLFNVGDVYAFGGGLEVGLTLGFANFIYVAPVLQPVIIRLGERGQHQLSLKGSIAVVSNYSYVGNFDISYAGTLQVFAGYTYLF